MNLLEYFQVYSSRLLEYCKEGFLCDTVVIAGGKAIKVHSVLLAAASPELKRVVDQQIESSTRVVILPKIDYVTLCATVYFIYTGELILPSGKDETSFKGLLIKLGLDMKRLSDCEIFSERNNELQFNTVPFSTVVSEAKDIKIYTVNIERSDLQNVVENSTTIMNKVPRECAKTYGKCSKKTKRSVSSPPSSCINHANTLSEIVKADNTNRAVECADDSTQILISDNEEISQDEIPLQNEVLTADDELVVSTCEYGVPESADGIVKNKKQNKVQEFSNDCFTKIKESNIFDLIGQNLKISDIDFEEVCENLGRGKRRKTSKLKLKQEHSVQKLSQSEVFAKIKEPELKLDLSQPFYSDPCLLSNANNEINESLQHRCQSCLKQFKTLATLKRHLKSCSVATDGELQTSDVSNVTDKSLERKCRRHVSVPEPMRKYACDKCDKKFSLPSLLRTHMMIHADQRPHMCPTCGTRFKRCSNLRIHMRIHSGQLCLLCYVCGRKFPSAAALKKHLSKPHVEYQCDTCGKSFNVKAQLSKHCLVEHGVFVNCRKNIDRRNGESSKSHLCPTCGRSFSTSHSYLTHRIIHRRICSICSAKFEGDAELEDHVRSEHPGQECLPQNWCSICRKSFSTERNLRNHLLLHSENRPFTCQTCSHSFVSIPRLSLHVQQYHNDSSTRKPVRERRPNFLVRRGRNTLASSGSKLKNETGVRRRYRMRNPESSKLDKITYTCAECNIVFVTWMTWKAHMDVHAGANPYTCSQCNKKFLYKGTLKSHMLIHTGELPYKCSECEKSFRQQGHLTMHMHTHRGTRPYACEMCDKSYMSRPDLRNHYSRVHNISIISTRRNKHNMYTINIPTSIESTNATLPSND